jgi:hypothetical protein
VGGFGKEGISRRLKQLDDDLLSLVKEGMRVELTIVGGSALMLLNLIDKRRVTTDIDVMEAARQAEVLLRDYDMNQDVATFAFRLPNNWRSRRQRIPFNGSVLDIYAPSDEDLVVLKLDAWREIDQADLKDMIRNNKLNFAKLQAILDDDTELRINYEDEDEWLAFCQRVEMLREFDRTFAKGRPQQ